MSSMFALEKTGVLEGKPTAQPGDHMPTPGIEKKYQ